MACTIQELLAQREQDVELAACYGQQLLQENKELTCELEKVRREAREQLESLQRQHQARNSELQRLGAVQMEEMDTEIVQLRAQLEEAQRVISTGKHRQIIRATQLNLDKETALVDNSTLKNEIERERRAREKAERKQEECVNELKVCFQEVNMLREQNKLLSIQLEKKVGENRRLQQNILNHTHTNRSLTEELKASQENYEYIEKLYQEAAHKIKELTDELNESQETFEQLKQSQHLSLSMNGFRPLTPNSITSGMSLMDEMNLLDQPDSVFLENEEVMLSRHQLMAGSVSSGMAEVAELLDCEYQSSSPRLGWSGHCSRCANLQQEVSRGRIELEQLNRQLIVAVEQKFKLQLEVEKWEADMEEMVKREITRSAESLKKTDKGTPKKTKGPPALKKSRSNRLFTT